MESPDAAPQPTLDAEKATLLLPLPRELFTAEPTRAAIESLGLHEKPELHLTIVGFDTGERLRALAPDAAERLSALAAEHGSWTVTPLPRFIYIEKNEELDGQPYRRQSLIQECDVPELAVFYASLAERFGEKFSVPFPHVTLGANSNIESRRLRGIGVYSRDDLAQMDVAREISVASK